VLLVGNDIWCSRSWRLFVEFGKNTYFVLHRASHLFCVGYLRSFLRLDVISHKLHCFGGEVSVITLLQVVVYVLDLGFVPKQRVLHVLLYFVFAKR
jgi:hypothetical protein